MSAGLLAAALAARDYMHAQMKANPMSEEVWRVHNLLDRALLAHHIERCAEDGKIAVVESGRDCDCVEYHGRVRVIDATLEAYNKLYDEVSEWADGPFRFEIMSPSEAEHVRYSSRDLVMEAREDGHPHSIHSEFP